MTVLEPLPGTQFGKADWVDYSNYWRDQDATWLMERSVLRYASAAARNTDWPTPTFGQVVYNESSLGANLDRVEMYSKQHNAWVPLLMLANIRSVKDDSTGVSLAHSGASGKGVTFEPTRTVFDNPIYVMGGVLSVNATGATIKTHATKAAVLTTDVNGLVSDSQITAPVLASTGALTAASATITALTAPNISMTGTLSGGVINGSSGTIGGVAMASNYAVASAGYVSQGGYFSGDATNAYLRQRNTSTGVPGTAVVQVTPTEVFLGGTGSSVWVNDAYLRIGKGKGIPWHNAAGTHVAWISPTIFSAGDPGAANYPDGTIWVS